MALFIPLIVINYDYGKHAEYISTLVHLQSVIISLKPLKNRLISHVAMDTKSQDRLDDN